MEGAIIITEVEVEVTGPTIGTRILLVSHCIQLFVTSGTMVRALMGIIARGGIPVLIVLMLVN